MSFSQPNLANQKDLSADLRKSTRLKFLLLRCGSQSRQLIDQDIKEEIAERIRVIKIEQHEQLMLAYDQENGEFLTQGLTAQEIEQNVVQRFPNRIFIFGTHVFSAKGTITNEFSTN